ARDRYNLSAAPRFFAADLDAAPTAWTHRLPSPSFGRARFPLRIPNAVRLEFKPEFIEPAKWILFERIAAAGIDSLLRRHCEPSKSPAGASSASIHARAFS